MSLPSLTYGMSVDADGSMVTFTAPDGFRYAMTIDEAWDLSRHLDMALYHARVYERANAEIAPTVADLRDEAIAEHTIPEEGEPKS